MGRTDKSGWLYDVGMLSAPRPPLLLMVHLTSCSCRCFRIFSDYILDSSVFDSNNLENVPWLYPEPYVPDRRPSREGPIVYKINMLHVHIAALRSWSCLFCTQGSGSLPTHVILK